VTPDDEVYWLLLSFVALDSEEQLAHLPAPVPGREDPRATDPSHNPLLALNFALYDYFAAWNREFDAARGWDFDDLLSKFATPSDGPGIFCLEELRGGEAWRELRAAALEVLSKAGLEPLPVPTPLPVFDLVAEPRE
jgi:hypothetical protein